MEWLDGSGQLIKKTTTASGFESDTFRIVGSGENSKHDRFEVFSAVTMKKTMKRERSG
jgi:hypothetical protein